VKRSQIEVCIQWTDEQLEAAGINRGRLIKIIRALRRASELMEGTGLHVYGESGSGYLIHSSRPEHFGREAEADHGAVIADVGLGFDGGGW
jgi:myo-inositol-hexaphosphate 3-phosphohydrolase